LALEMKVVSVGGGRGGGQSFGSSLVRKDEKKGRADMAHAQGKREKNQKVPELNLKKKKGKKGQKSRSRLFRKDLSKKKGGGDQFNNFPGTLQFPSMRAMEPNGTLPIPESGKKERLKRSKDPTLGSRVNSRKGRQKAFDPKA